MLETSIWLSGKEACLVLRVEEETLEGLREKGLLKPGFHWRSSSDPEQLPWKPKAFYCLSECRKIIEFWQIDNPSFYEIAS